MLTGNIVRFKKLDVIYTGDDYVAVSYTHLDVYKRQAYETEFNDLYKKVMENEHMRDYEVARAEIGRAHV